jgi:hypothetical protein
MCWEYEVRRMSAVWWQVALTVWDHAWSASFVPPAWFLAKTRIARTAYGIVRACAWDSILRLKGGPLSKHRKLLTDAAQEISTIRDRND